MIPFTIIEAQDHEIEFLKDKIGNNKKVLEIGSFSGKNTVILAEENKVYAIDPFLDNYDPKDMASPIVSQVRDLFKSRIAGHDIVWFEETSEQTLKHFNEELDAIFIDGEHSRRALEIDIQFMKFLKIGGLIAFHDDSDSWPEVRDFIKEKMQDHEFVGKIGSLSVFIKKF